MCTRILRRPLLRLLVLSALALAPAAQAEIYKFVDENGLVTYTNMPRPGAKPQLVLPDLNAAPSAKPATEAAPTKKPGAKVPTPSYFPKVDVTTQRKRDDMRRQLLVEELRSEERNLAAARSTLAAGSRQPGADLAKLGDAVRMHEKNIQMLNKELSHIR